MKRDAANRARVGRLLCGLVSAVALVLVLLFWRELASLASFRKVDDYPLYVMRLEGGYDLDDLSEESARQTTHWLPAEGLVHTEACSVFAALSSNGDKVLGRNFDWHNRPTLLLFSEPDDGYASVSMVDLTYLGFDTEAPSWGERLRLLDSPFWPFDGLNEAGLAVGMMAVPHAEPGYDPGRMTLGSLHVIRLLLDRAGSVKEALALLEQYNVSFEGGPPLHYLIADAGGNSAVVEYLDGSLQILRNEQPWQVATNLLLSGLSADQAGALCPRYEEAWRTLETAGGSLSPSQAMGLLDRVSQPNTMWSVVYDMSDGGVWVVVGEEYDRVHEFDLATGLD